MPFARTSPVLAAPRPNILGLLFVSTISLGISIGISSLSFYYNVIRNRSQAKLLRRRAQASEMKVLKARLDRFHAKLDEGQVMSEEEMEEGKRMERLFRRWLRALEDDAAADDEGRSAAVRIEKWPGWF